MARGDDRTKIIEALREYHSAMVDARTHGLNTTLDEAFFLEHVT